MQSHIGRLPVTYYDANKTGMLVSRIMNDVEGIRNLIGTGLVDFAGGVLTRHLSLAVMIRISPLLTGHGAGRRGCCRRRAAVQGVRRYPPDLPRARQNHGRGHRPAHRIAGRRARHQGLSCREREAEVFSGGVQRILNNILKTLTATSLMGLVATLLMGVVGAMVMFVGAHQIMARQDATRRSRGVHHVYGLPDRARVSGGQHGHADQPKRWPAWSARAKCCANGPRIRIRAAWSALNGIAASCVFDHVSFAYEAGKEVLHGHFVRVASRAR